MLAIAKAEPPNDLSDRKALTIDPCKTYPNQEQNFWEQVPCNTSETSSDDVEYMDMYIRTFRLVIS